VGIVLFFIVASFFVQTVADVREDIQEHVDADEHEHAHGKKDQGEFGEVSNGMERFVRDRGNELRRGAWVTF